MIRYSTVIHAVASAKDIRTSGCESESSGGDEIIEIEIIEEIEALTDAEEEEEEVQRTVYAVTKR